METNEQKLKDIQFKQALEDWVNYGKKFGFFEYLSEYIINNKKQNDRRTNFKKSNCKS